MVVVESKDAYTDESGKRKSVQKSPMLIAANQGNPTSVRVGDTEMGTIEKRVGLIYSSITSACAID